MTYLPHFPLHFNLISLFGLTLLLGLIGGEVARRIPLFPVISGYIAIGFILGPNGFGVITLDLLTTARIFVDISLGMILFEVGRQLDFKWLWYDPGLLCSSLAECSLSFIAIFLFMYYGLNLTWIASALAGTCAMATSPAVIMMVAHDLSAQGPVSRRTQILTSLNNLFALLSFTFLLPFASSFETKQNVAVDQILYMLLGPLVFAILVFILIQMLAVLTGKVKENQFILFVGSLILTIGMTQVFNLPTALTLLILGVLIRNLDFKHMLMEIDFSWSGRLFIILLFVITGTYLRIGGLKTMAGTIFIFIALRSLALFMGIIIFKKATRLTFKQVISLSLALTPMAGLAMNMSYVLGDFNPDINRQIATIIASVVTVLQILGPIATQFAFIWNKENAPR